MKAPQYQPTVKELVEELGAIQDENRPNMVGLIVKDRVVWVNVHGSILVDEYVSKALIKADARRRGVIAPIEQPKVNVRSLFDEAPPMDFLPDDIPIDVGSAPLPAMEFDMGRAGGEKKILGLEESETLELPAWLDSATGIASKHEVAEGWE